VRVSHAVTGAQSCRKLTPDAARASSLAREQGSRTLRNWKKSPAFRRERERRRKRAARGRYVLDSGDEVDVNVAVLYAKLGLALLVI